MIEAPGLPLTIIAFLLVIGPLVFVHEMGHYLAGRLFGVKALSFSIGMGSEAFGFTDRRGTRWKFSWIPLGGFVRFSGDLNATSQPSDEWLAMPEEERSKTFPSKPLWQRAIIIAAGPVTNFVVAILILAGFALAYGDLRTPAVVGQVVPASAAAAAGLQPGDRVTALGGRGVDTFEDMVHYVKIRPDEAVRIDFLRDGTPQSVVATIATKREGDRFGNEYRIGQLGISGARPVLAPVGLIEAPVVAVRQTGEILTMMVDTIGQIVTGRRPLDELGGPLRIAKVSGEQLALGVQGFVFLVALISINLGFINLLPVPMLDGGHLFFYAVEAIRRRPVSARVQEWAYRGGAAALLTLMVFVTINDLGSFGVWKGLAGLIG